MCVISNFNMLNLAIARVIARDVEYLYTESLILEEIRTTGKRRKSLSKYSATLFGTIPRNKAELSM